MLESILSVLGQFLLQEAAKWGTKKAQEAYKTRAHPATHHIQRAEFIYREQALDAMKEAIEADQQTKIVAFTGSGGIGKTRLLEQAAVLVDVCASPSVFWAGIIDLYHVDLHNLLELNMSIIKQVDPTQTYFTTYRSQFARFQTQMDAGVSREMLQRERSNLQHLFLAEYQVFAQSNRPVLAFDTLEKLSTEPHLIQTICNLHETQDTVYEWLTQVIGNLPNTVILFAGRPCPVLTTELANLYPKPTGILQQFTLNEFQAPGKRRLLRLYFQNMPDFEADSERRERYINYLVDTVPGIPVQLALWAELYAQGFIDLSPETFEADSAHIQQAIMDALFDYTHERKRVFFFLALARKGLTADLLHHLEPHWNPKDCQARLDEIRHLSIVKTRQNTKEVFLHDALYELFDQCQPYPEQSYYCYERLADYYRLDHDDGTRPYTAAENLRMITNTLYYECHCNLQRGYQRAYLHWSEEAIKSFDQEWDTQLRSEIATFLNLSHDHPEGVQHPLTRFAQQDTLIRWIKRLVILACYEQAIASINLILQHGPSDYQQLKVAVSFKPQDITPAIQAQIAAICSEADDFFWGHLLAVYGEALSYTDMGLPTETMQTSIHLLEAQTLDPADDLYWLNGRILGRVYNTLGYLQTRRGHYANAIESYHAALQHYSAVDVFDEKADTLNNLAYLLALLGDLDHAKAYVTEALSIRKDLDKQFPLALSYNTRGLIYSLQQVLFSWDRNDCEKALAIFCELNASRGQGLAYNALGYVLRKKAQLSKLGICTPETALELYEEAVSFLQQAIKIFSPGTSATASGGLTAAETVNEPIRLWEAYNELGCVYRDWDKLLHERNQLGEANIKLIEATGFLEQALAVATKKSTEENQSNEENKGQHYNLSLQAADTYDDLAEIAALQRDQAKFEAYLNHCETEIPSEYTLDQSDLTTETPPNGNAYWEIKGKVHMQRGRWALNNLEQDMGNDYTHSLNRSNLQTTITHFVQAAEYFTRYYHFEGRSTQGDAPVLRRRVKAMVTLLTDKSIPLDEVQDLAMEIAHEVELTNAKFVTIANECV
ncbi:MAG: ATP-binding protein [Chloroflexota bacterium]